jgi:hypothetical protein
MSLFVQNQAVLSLLTSFFRQFPFLTHLVILSDVGLKDFRKYVKKSSFGKSWGQTASGSILCDLGERQSALRPNECL